MNVSPLDYRDHRPLALSGRDLWENHGWMVWDRVAGDDVLFWLSPYRIVGGRPQGPFALPDSALSQTLMLRASRDEGARDELSDARFLAVGYDLGDHLPGAALEVHVDSRRAVWSIGARRFVAEPPTWRVQGEHAGVAVDLTMTAMGPPMWLTDPHQTVEQSMERWFLQCARARGRVECAGRTLDIDGYASHERHVHCGDRYDPPRLLDGRGVTWHSGSGSGVQVIALSRPSIGLTWARLVFDDGTVELNGESGVPAIEETHFWNDPESRLRVPRAWRCHFRSEAGSLEISARARARAFYLWNNFKFGCTVCYWWLADAVVKYVLADGRRREEQFQYVVHDNRLLYRKHQDL